MKFTFDMADIIALILVLGSIGLLASGVDGEVKSILTVAAGWVFGRRLPLKQLRK